MSATLEETILKKLQGLPDGKQQEVLALVESLLDNERLTAGEPKGRSS